MVLPFARWMVRLAREQRQLGLELGGEVGARTAHRQGMPVSPDTLLRLVRQEPLPERLHLGVDDFALRKGQVYGTIWVDLDQHRPILSGIASVIFGILAVGKIVMDDNAVLGLVDPQLGQQAAASMEYIPAP